MIEQSQKSDNTSGTDRNAKQGKLLQEPIQKLGFAKIAENEMIKCVEQHATNHTLYRPTCIHKSIIDEKRGIAVWVLFEQIDTDRCTPEGSGWLGDQYRYSVWLLKEGETPAQLFEDHSYLRSTVSGLTNSRGRDPEIDLISLEEDGIMIGIAPDKAEGYSYQKMKKKLTFEGKLVDVNCCIMEEGENAILAIAPRLGYDRLSDRMQAEGRDDAAAFVWDCENGSTYGYSVLYFAMKKNGKLEVKALADTRSSKNYIHIKSAKVIDGKVVIDTSAGKYEIELNAQ